MKYSQNEGNRSSFGIGSFCSGNFIASTILDKSNNVLPWQAYPESRATCEECTQGLQAFPGAIGDLSDVMEEDLSHHYCHKPDDPCYITEFVNDWFPAVLDNFVAGQAADVCAEFGACSQAAVREVTCEECETGVHSLSKWLEREDQVVQHVAFLQEGLCAGDADCQGGVADWYPDMNKHATQNFIVPHAIPVLCADLCTETTSADTTMYAGENNDIADSYKIINL